MQKESKFKIVWDCVWIAVVMTALVIGSVMIPVSCAGADWLEIPDRHAYFQSPALQHEFDMRFEYLRLIRDEFPEFEYLVQVWVDMDTGVFNFVMTAALFIENEDGSTTWEFRVMPDLITTYDFRQLTGWECIFSYYLADYEWFNGRQGDI